MVKVSSALDRLRRRGDLQTTNRRYVREQTPTLEEISDPDTTDDERRPSWREWAGENRGLAIVGLLFGTLVVVALLFMVGRYAPDMFATLWDRRELTFGVAGLVVGTVIGTRKLRAKMMQWDQLAVKSSNNEVTRYYGYYLTSDLGDYDLFVPVAGFSFMGHRSHVYRISDISRQIVRKRGSAWDEDDPAIMRLDPAWTGVNHTDSGTVVVTICDGFEPDSQAKESNLRPVIPEEGSKDRLLDMKQQLKKTREEKEHYEELATKYKRQRDNVLEEMDRPLDEVLDQHIKFYERVEGARSRDDRQGERKDNGLGPSKDPAAVEQQLGGGDDE